MASTVSQPAGRSLPVRKEWATLRRHGDESARGEHDRLGLVPDLESQFAREDEELFP
jgi:hypothetical protein